MQRSNLKLSHIHGLAVNLLPGDMSLRAIYTVPNPLPLPLTTAQIVTRTCQSTSLVLTDRHVTHSTNAAERGKKKNLRDRDLSEFPKEDSRQLRQGVRTHTWLRLEGRKKHPLVEQTTSSVRHQNLKT